MPYLKNKSRIQRTYFTGMNSFDEPTEISEFQCALIENCRVNKAGQIIQRSGQTQIGGAIASGAYSDATCLGLGILEASGVAYAYRKLEDVIYRLSGSAWVPISSGVFSTTARASMIQAISKLYIGDGVNNIHSVDTSDVVTDLGNAATSPPRSDIFTYHDNRMFYVIDDIAYFSDVIDPSTVTKATNLFNAKKGAKGNISQLLSIKEKDLVIYKTNTILNLNTSGATPLTDWELEILNENIGCPAGNTVVNVGNDHIFLSNEPRVRILSRSEFNTLQVGDVGREVQNYIDDINWSAIATSRAAYFDNKYILAIPTNTATTPDLILVYDVLATIESRQKGLTGNSWTIIPKGTWDINEMIVSRYNTAPELVAGQDASEEIYSLFNGTSDGGTAISGKVVFRAEDFGFSDVDKVFNHIFVKSKGGQDSQLQFFYSIDKASDASTAPPKIDTKGGVLTLPFTLPDNLNDDTQVTDELYIHKRGKFCQISMQHSVLDKTLNFLGYYMYSRILDQTEK